MHYSPAAAARVAERLAKNSRHQLSDNRILIVDRDPIFSLLVANTLSLLFDEVVSVRDSLEALQEMQEQEYDLVILDIPGRQSESLLLLARLLFADDVHSGRIFGLWNAEAPEADLAMETAKEFGVERMLRAPYNLQSLVEEVAGVLQARDSD